MKFLTKDLLIEHTVKHTGERPYDCEICGMKFSHKFALKAHLISHDINYNEKISQTLTNASQMTKNRFSHRKNKPNKTNIVYVTAEYVESTSSSEELDEEKRDQNLEPKETLGSIVNNLSQGLNHGSIIQLVTLSPVPSLILNEENKINNHDKDYEFDQNLTSDNEQTKSHIK